MFVNCLILDFVFSVNFPQICHVFEEKLVWYISQNWTCSIINAVVTCYFPNIRLIVQYNLSIICFLLNYTHYSQVILAGGIKNSAMLKTVHCFNTLSDEFTDLPSMKTDRGGCGMIAFTPSDVSTGSDTWERGREG